MSQTLISLDGLRATGITLSRCQIWRKEREGTFPRRVQISAARIAWVEAEVNQWLADRIAARPPAAVAA